MPAAGGVQRPRLTNLSHFASYAHDLERSAAFYRNVLGYEDISRKPDPTGRGDRAVVKINDLQYVELVPEHEPGTDRLERFGFVTDDAEAMRAYLASRGVEVPRAVSAAGGGRLSFSVKDPDGHVVDFVQHEPPLRPTPDGPTDGSDDRISTCLMHIGFISRSLERSMGFYREILGCVEVWRGSRDKKQLSWVQLRLPDSIDYIEFMLYDAFPSVERLGVLNHYGLEVPSIRDAKELLEGRRGYFGYTRPLDAVIGVCHHRILNTFDPDGTRSELMERPTYDGKPRPSSNEPPPR